jgi:hypothetical protein
MRRRPVQLRIDYRLLHQEDGFPALHTLHVHQAVSLDIGSEPLMAMLDSRLASKLSIVTLTLEHLYRIDKSVVESGPDPQLLEAISDRGLRIRIETPTVTWSHGGQNAPFGGCFPFLQVRETLTDFADDDSENLFPPLKFCNDN